MDLLKETIKFEDLKVHRTVSDDGTEIAGRIIGHGPPLLLMPAGPGDSETSWCRVLPFLIARFTCYLVNTRSRGLSGKSEDLSPRRLAEDVSAFAKSIGEPVSVVCWGTFVLPNKVLNGETISGIAAYEPFVSNLESKEETEHQNELFGHMGELVYKGHYSEAANYFLENFRYYNDEDMAVGAPKVFWKTAEPNIPVFFQELDQANRSKEPDPTDHSVLREIKVPTLLLKGSQSHPIFIKSIDYCYEHLDNSEVRQIEGTGHFGPYIRPEAVARNLVEFFENVQKKKDL
ncbi:alpha/beta fold hydrolase [Aquiflexum sp.]|uniref:alpha/beta fold hydrolase n=1 Tax=Aquiflexum sp. TaxID=1872584 RepID=UPI00359316D8